MKQTHWLTLEKNWILEALTAWQTYAWLAGIMALTYLSTGSYIFALPWLWPLLASSAVLIEVDRRHQALPDVITIPLLVLGLAGGHSLWGLTVVESAVGAAIGTGVLLFVLGLYWLVRRQLGMGLGDVKLLAALGAWGGALPLLPLLLCSSVLALLFLPIRRLFLRVGLSQPVPFGPFLIIAAWVVWLYGHWFWYGLAMWHGFLQG